ncbi:Mnn10p [Sugiyamaella lignohabitans]|uniref:Mnn10p n=1 Tax=Sugiyamaella lignohabitans TaxID=796027 RepID=A0A161HF58_9ASCO|nr:Mnn10p [Sugiyamaella lignohabitans]ANB14090.1 Mnn10p [Sugiyamaella lignohabitans]
MINMFPMRKHRTLVALFLGLIVTWSLVSTLREHKPATLSLSDLKPVNNGHSDNKAHVTKLVSSPEHSGSLENPDQGMAPKLSDISKSDTSIKSKTSKPKSIGEKALKEPQDYSKDSEQFVGVPSAPAPAQVAPAQVQGDQILHHPLDDIYAGISINPVRAVPTPSVAERQLHNKYQAVRDHLMELENLTIHNTFHVPQSQRVKNRIEPCEEQILILSACDGIRATDEDPEFMSLILQNRIDYANLHNYSHYFVDTSKFQTGDKAKLHPVWFKIAAIREAFEMNPAAQWVWWLDMDGLIMNPKIDLAQHLLHPHVLEQRLTYDRPINDVGGMFTGLVYKSRGQVRAADIDFVFSQDSLGVNAGSFFIRRSKFSSFVLDIWDSPQMIDLNFSQREQDVFNFLLTKYREVYDHTGLVPQRLFNSYHSTNTKSYGRYWPGDLVVHFAGKSRTYEYRELWNSYWDVSGTLNPPIYNSESE